MVRFGVVLLPIMKTLAFLLAAAVTLCAQAYTPKGKLTKSTWANSKIFPGTTRDVQVYVPAQYDGTKPACVMIFQDGNGFASAQGPWHVPAVMASLIEQGARPLTIAIFIEPGLRPAAAPNKMARY